MFQSQKLTYLKKMPFLKKQKKLQIINAILLIKLIVKKRGNLYFCFCTTCDKKDEMFMWLIGAFLFSFRMNKCCLKGENKIDGI